MNIFNNPPEAPIPFQYKSAESSFSVYEWDVEFDRDKMEFARLSDVTKKGFKLQGSGKADVETAPWFKPNGEYQVKIKGNRGAKVVKTRADEEGKLRVKLDFSSKHVGDELSVSIKHKKN